MYAVTGANGQLGQLAIDALLTRVGAAEVVALVREPEKAAHFRNLGVQVRAFDYDKLEQSDAALDGVTRLLFISSPAPDRRIAQHQAVVDAASRASVEAIAYTSIIHADANPLSLAASHRETEAMIVRSGLSHAILRNSWYVENYLIGAEAAIEKGVLYGSMGTAMVSAATRADYADAAAAVLTGDYPTNQIYELAGDEAFTLADVAEVLSEAAGRQVVYEDVPEQAYRNTLIDAGLPIGFATALAEYSAKASGGILADESGTLSRLIKRPTGSMRDVILGALRGHGSVA